MTAGAERKNRPDLPFKDMDSKVGWTVTSFEVENCIFSSALRSMPSAMLGNGCIVCDAMSFLCVVLGRLFGLRDVVRQ